MKGRVAAILSLFLVAYACNVRKVTSDEENTIISLALQQFADLGGYTILDPRTRLYNYDFADRDKIRQTKEWISKGLKIPGYDATALIDRLFERNSTQITLGLRSDPSRGYLIDWDGKFADYFAQGRGGWDEFYSKNPAGAGMTTVSAPVLDKRHKIVLIYIGTQTEGLAGVEYIFAYSFDGGRLKKLTQQLLWVS